MLSKNPPQTLTTTVNTLLRHMLLSVCQPLPFIVYMAYAVRLSQTIAQCKAFGTSGGTIVQPLWRRRRLKRLHMRCVCTVSILIALLLWMGFLAVGERCLQYAAALEMLDVDGGRGPEGESMVMLLWLSAMAGGMAAVTYSFESLPLRRNAMPM